MDIVLAGLSAILYGSGDFCGGAASRRQPVLTVMVYSQAVGLLIAAAAVFALGQPLPRAADLLWGASAGILGTAGLVVLYRALATGVVAVVSPTAAVVGAVLPVLLGLAAGDRPGALAAAGILIALAAIVLLSVGPAAPQQRGTTRRSALLGAAAGAAFGLFFFTISRTTHASGLWPLVAARCATISLGAGFAAVSRRSLRPKRDGLGLLMVSGALDMGANIAFLMASRIGLLSITAVVTSLYPAPTVILAVIVFREKLTLKRALGLALALAGVACISA